MGSNSDSDFKTGDFDIPHILKEASSAYLFSLLREIEGSKDLVLDAELIWSLDYIANVHQLKACEVEKIFKLEPGASPGETSRCVYLVRSVLQTTKIIADHIKANRHSNRYKNYWIIFVPRKLHVCDMVLEREGVYGYVKLLEFPLGFIPVDTDLISIELMDFFPAFFLENDQTHLHTAAMCLVQLQKFCGIIPRIYGQGRCSDMVVKIMKTIMDEAKDQISESENISHLIIVDRDIDYVSVLLTQLTYEGLLDETFDIKSGRASFGKNVTGQDQTVKIILNNHDAIYSEIRNCHFTSVLGILRDKAKQLQTKCETTQMSLGDMKLIVAHKMRNMQQERLLPLYIGACEVIIKEKNEGNFQEQLTTEHNLIEGIKIRECQTVIEEIINKQTSIFCSLRLLCLLSVTQDGLLSKDYKTMVLQFLQSYGHKHMLTFQNLKKIGLFVEQAAIYLPMPAPMSSGGVTASKIAGRVAAAVASFPRKSSFKAISKKLALIPTTDNVHDVKTPSDMSYVFSGAYIPLVGKLTEQLIHNDGIHKLEDIIKLLPGPTINLLNSLKPGTSQKQIVTVNHDQKTSKVVIVYFLGGVTYAEVAALRFLSKVKGFKIIIATTSIINGKSLMKMLIPREIT